MDGKMEADKEMSDSLRKAKAIVDLEYDEPMNPEMEAILREYESGKISHVEFLRRTAEKANEIYG